MIFHLHFVLTIFLVSVHSTALVKRPAVEQLYAFPKGTRIENLLILRNGSLLLTLFTEPSLYRFDPNSGKVPVLVRRFSGQISLLGIAQLQGKSSNIAVIAGNLIKQTLSSDGDITDVSGSFSIILLSESGRIVTSFLISEARFLEGLTILPQAPQYLLASDSNLGVVWRLDTVTGAVDKVIIDPIFGSGKARLLSGIHVLGDYVYFTVAGDTLGRIHINPNGTPAGKPAETTTLGYYQDFIFGDFAFGPNGTFYITNTYGNVIDRRQPFDKVGLEPVLEPGIVEKPSAVAFTKDPARGNVLYAVSAGTLPGYRGKGVGGQIVRINLDVPQPDLPDIENSITDGFCSDLGCTSSIL